VHTLFISGAGEIKLSVLVKNGIIRVGDVIAYKRCFTLSDVTVEKDCIVSDTYHCFSRKHGTILIFVPTYFIRFID
jgi:hypothetical protein